ncbi:hypothetical protein TNCV_4792611 [Trichonephila clavipes]|nr:hypothetical protein TNCV_4792611 [Trichonephila clavipes]
MSSDAIRNNLNECMTKYDYYSERFYALLPVLEKKATLEYCMKEGLIGSSYVCPKCGKSMQLRGRTVQFGIVRSQTPSSEEETGKQNYIAGISIYLYGTTLKRDISSRGMYKSAMVVNPNPPPHL